MTAIPKAPHQIATAMKDKEHLKAWLNETGRRYLLFDALEMVDALTFPQGVEGLMQVIQAYRDLRITKASSRMTTVNHHGTPTQVALPKTDVLEVEELDAAIRYFVRHMLERNPDWKLDGPAL